MERFSLVLVWLAAMILVACGINSWAAYSAQRAAEITGVNDEFVR